MRRLSGLEYSLAAIVVVSLIITIITKGITIWVKIWLISQGLFLMVVLSKFSEEEHRKMERSVFLPGVILVILEVMPWWVIKWGGILASVAIIGLAIFIV